jgi:hypothetical protein
MRRGEQQPAARRSRLPVLIGGGFLLVVAALVAALVLTRGGATPPPPDNGGDRLATASTAGDPLGPAVPQPADLTGRRTGGAVVFRWTNPQPKDGDSYQWYRTDEGASPRRHVTRQPTATVRAPGTVCIAVILVRGDGTSSPEPARACGASGPSTAGTS